MGAHDLEMLNRSRGLRDFAKVARIKGLGGQTPGDERELAERYGNARVQEVCGKAAVAALDSDQHGEFRVTAEAFLQSLRPLSAFERLLERSRQIPWKARHTATVAIAEVTESGEGTARKLAELSLDSGQLTRKQAGALLIVTKEFLREGGPGVDTFIETELRRAVAKAVDSIAIAALLDGVTPTTSTGTIKDDVRALLDSITLHQDQRLFWLGSADVAAALGIEVYFGGGDGRLPLQPMGEFLGQPFAITNELPVTSPESGALALIDASQILTSDNGVRLDRTEQAAIEMDDDPANAVADGSPASPTGAQLVSLWQTGSVGIRVLRRFAYARPRSEAIALIDGITW